MCLVARGGDASDTCEGRAWASLFASQEKFFQELFEGELASQAAAEFEQAMQELAREEPHLVEQFQKLSEAAGRVGSDAASQQEFTSCLKETLSGLAKNATDLQSSSASEEELAKALEGLGLEESDGESSVLPVMRSIMQSLLSKDVLYPSLKEITEKYPEWLRQHGEALPAEQYERYRAQHGVMGRICQQLEGERPGEGEEERRARFETLLDLMQQDSPRCPLGVHREQGSPGQARPDPVLPGFNLSFPSAASEPPAAALTARGTAAAVQPGFPWPWDHRFPLGSRGPPFSQALDGKGAALCAEAASAH
ncbi:PREDICTED: peroxisomal biogenesis factor 19 [Nipponia nippon]|uniref:peroxisomal biogenesis factor 19 n=1 Tax=Nipponia nippon TaxID=128390 RepID=UPI00051115BE|nr:PREDICTED: peroxisomal biogenesis factor 19 [Nipponia nippon]